VRQGQAMSCAFCTWSVRETLRLALETSLPNKVSTICVCPKLSGPDRADSARNSDTQLIDDAKLSFLPDPREHTSCFDICDFDLHLVVSCCQILACVDTVVGQVLYRLRYCGSDSSPLWHDSSAHSLTHPVPWTLAATIPPRPPHIVAKHNHMRICGTNNNGCPTESASCTSRRCSVTSRTPVRCTPLYSLPGPPSEFETLTLTIRGRAMLSQAAKCPLPCAKQSFHCKPSNIQRPQPSTQARPSASPILSHILTPEERAIPSSAVRSMGMCEHVHGGTPGFYPSEPSISF
jgi:hypothetical protein